MGHPLQAQWLRSAQGDGLGVIFEGRIVAAVEAAWDSEEFSRSKTQ